jgi:LPS export ABC transporter protein LptC
MTRRRLELAVLAFGALFVVVLVLFFRPGHRPSRSSAAREPLPNAPSAPEAGQATTVLKGFDYTETLRGKPLFRIQSERTVGFGPGAGLVPNIYVLEKVTLTLYPEQGEAVTVHSDRAEYDQRSKAARLSGNVRWTDERGAIGETERIDFEPSQGLLVAPGAIHLTRGTFDLAARSGRYDVSHREVVLEGPVRGTGTGEGTGGLTALSADRAVYRREESLLELSGHVSAAGREGDRLTAQRLVMKLEGEAGRLQWLRADGDVRGILASPPVPARNAAATRTAGVRRYVADSAALLFGPDGHAQSLSLTGAPARVSDARGLVQAQTLEVSFQAGRASSASARGRVHVETEKSRADSEHASLSFAPSGDVETMELSGAVQMQGEDRTARAEKAVDLPERGVWILSGGPAGSAAVESGGSRVSASRIEIDEKRRVLTGDGSARAVFMPVEPRPGQPAPKIPALLGDPSKPTYGKAQRIVFDDASRVASLAGSATLWQDASSLSGDAITLNDTERSAVAVGNTRTVFISSDGGPKAQASSQHPAPNVVTAHRMTYREADSKALFEGNVVVTRGQWRASAQKATAIVGSDRKIERVEMEGGVALADAGTGRSGRAERAVDWAREGKTVLEGSPAWVADAQGNRVAGAVLTITDQGRRVEVTAPPGGKTETIYRTRSS